MWINYDDYVDKFLQFHKFLAYENKCSRKFSKLPIRKFFSSNPRELQRFLKPIQELKTQFKT